MAQGGTRSTGVVTWFNAQKGFGFITADDDGVELFVHQSSIKSEGYQSLAEGEQVEFLVDTGDDGRTKAVAMTGPNGANVQGSSNLDGFGGSGGRGSRGGGGGYGGYNGGRGGGLRGRGGYGGGGHQGIQFGRWRERNRV